MSTSSVLASEAVREAAGPGKLVPFFHLVVFAKYFRVWTWHFGSAASVLPGANAFGWFFRFLTFWSYTAQAIQFGIIVLAHFTKVSVRCKGVAGHSQRHLSLSSINRGHTYADGDNVGSLTT